MTASSVTVRITPKVAKTVDPSSAITVFADSALTTPVTDLLKGVPSQDLFLKQSGPPLVPDNVEDVVVITNYTVGKPKA